MKIVVAGGGQLAYFLADSLLDNDHEISIIELDAKHAEKLATMLEDPNAKVINGDCIDLNILRQAGLEDADCFIASTGRDEVNIIACQLAREVFRTKRTITRVKNPKNRRTCVDLGIDLVYSPTSILVSMIEQEIDYEGLRMVYNVPAVRQNIVEFRVSENSKMIGKKLKSDIFPGSSRAVLLVYEDRDAEIPMGDSVIEAGMKILAICNTSDYESLFKTFIED